MASTTRTTKGTKGGPVTDAEYRALAQFRRALRSFFTSLKKPPKQPASPLPNTNSCSLSAVRTVTGPPPSERSLTG
jgi:hypothetical protein